MAVHFIWPHLLFLLFSGASFPESDGSIRKSKTLVTISSFVPFLTRSNVSHICFTIGTVNFLEKLELSEAGLPPNIHFKIP